MCFDDWEVVFETAEMDVKGLGRLSDFAVIECLSDIIIRNSVFICKFELSFFFVKLVLIGYFLFFVFFFGRVLY